MHTHTHTESWRIFNILCFTNKLRIFPLLFYPILRSFLLFFQGIEFKFYLPFGKINGSVSMSFLQAKRSFLLFFACILRKLLFSTHRLIVHMCGGSGGINTLEIFWIRREKE